MHASNLQPQRPTEAATAASPGHTPLGSPQRFDIYAGIHKALRHRMASMLQQLGRMDVDDAADCQRTTDALRALLHTLRQHVKHENDFLHTAMEARRPSAATRSASDHVEHLVAIADLEDEVAALHSAAAHHRPALALRLYRHYALFMADNLEHMQLEESHNNTLLWAMYDDAELLAMHDRLIASIPPQEMAPVLDAMARALSTRELTHVCLDLRSKLPGEAFVGTLAQVGRALEPARRARLEDALRAAA